MKIPLLIVHPFDPLGSKIGGPEVYIKDFIRFAPKELQIKLIGTLSKKNRQPLGQWSTAALAGKEFEFLPLLLDQEENIRSLLPLSLRFAIRLKALKLLPEGVICFNRLESALFFLKWPFAKFMVIHNDINKQINGKSEILWSKLPWFYFRLERLVFGSMSHIYTVSSNSIDFYSKRYPEYKDKFSFLPTWADPAVFYPAGEDKSKLKERFARAHHGLNVNNDWVIFVGRLQEQKQPLRAVEAFAKAVAQKPAMDLIIVGEGNLREKVIAKIKELNISSRTVILPWLKQPELAGLYRSCDCLLLSSDFEGMPRVILEAMACGIPVVSTKAGEARSLVKSGFSGELAEGFRAEELSAALLRLFNQKKRYTPDNCGSRVKEYAPQDILKPVYGKIALTYQNSLRGID